MNTETFLPLNMLSTRVATTSTLASISVDLGPYFDVGRREVTMVYSWSNASTSVSTLQSVTFWLEESDTNSSTANAASVSTDAVVGSTYLTPSTQVAISGAMIFQRVMLSKRYVRVLAVGSSSGQKTGIAAGVLIRKRAV